MKPVNPGSNIHSVGYERESKTLVVAFRDGDAIRSTWYYADVPQKHYKGMREADDAGEYLRDHIIGQYEIKRREVGE